MNTHPEITQHKRAKYQSPKVKILSRKKNLVQERWKRNVNKCKRVHRKEYTSTVRGEITPEKTVKP